MQKIILDANHDYTIDYFSILNKEVWREIAAEVIADLRLYAEEHNLEGEEQHPVNLICHLVWAAKDSIFNVNTMEQFHEIVGQIKMGQEFVKALGD